MAYFSATTIHITWTRNSTNESGFHIYDGSNLMDTVGAGTTGDNILDLTPGSYNCLRVEAYNTLGNGVSGWACVTMPQNSGPPPGGTWVSPTNGTTYSGSSVTLAAQATPSSNGYGVNHVTFTAWCPALGSGVFWVKVCRVYAPAYGNTYTCNFDLSNVPHGSIQISFDVYDVAGDVNQAPNGVHTIDH